MPPELPALLKGLAKEVIRAQPRDVAAFAARHFEVLVAAAKEGAAEGCCAGVAAE